ncbi:MAG: pilus assembly protein PilP [Gammaproteobacteria bacterium]|nr:MAG: pilus assembly protein PilP [Gammaproteobacteria bacterium]RLA22935.1 MAG: pilus assembly protein PilP [Gammaproteobacteria bacterium]
MLGIVMTTLLAACGSDGHQDLRDYVAEVKARDQIAIEPLPEIKTFETFVFDETGLRDPFVPAEIIQDSVEMSIANGGIHPDAGRRKEELESYSLDSLRMMGTLELKGLYWGLVKTSDGTIHRVLPGNHLGMNHGKINRILGDKIELTEIISDGAGSWNERQAALALAE